MASPRSLAALGASFALAACGGGGGSPASTPPPPPASTGQAVLSVSLVGGASPGIDHLWVTITGVAMHADASHVLGDGDAGWVVLPLAAPVTVDLADRTRAQGQTVSLLKQSVSRLGTYAQLRLLVAPPDPAGSLQSSARTLGLSWNDEVQYTDAGGPHSVPLEIPEPGAGLRLSTPFTLSADTTTPVSIQWSAHDSLVRRASASGVDRFTVRDELQLYNQQLMTALGDGNLQIDGSLFDSISGQLDTARFCTGSDTSNCIHDVVASATSLSADKAFHAEVRSVAVAADGSFILYPLPSDSAYDVVIHGGNMQTIVVRNVFVDPTGILRPLPTELSSTAAPIVPVLDTTGRSVTVPGPLSPAAGRVFFGQTIPGSGSGGAGSPDVPYVIASAAADPATGAVLDTVALPGGPLHDASFDASTDGNGTPPAFTTVTPAEGAGAWSVWMRGTSAEGTGATTVLAAAATSVLPPAAPRLSGFADGGLGVTLSGASSNGADHAELIVSDDGGTVAVADVSALLAHGGSTTLTVPAGSNAAAPTAGVYGVALRTWIAGSEADSTRWTRTSVPIDLRGTATGSATLTLP